MEINKSVRAFLKENFGFRGSIDDLSDDDNLIQAAILDSVGVLSLIAFLEETFQIQVTDDDVDPDNMGSVQQISDFVKRKLS